MFCKTEDVHANATSPMHIGVETSDCIAGRFRERCEPLCIV